MTMTNLHINEFLQKRPRVPSDYWPTSLEGHKNPKQIVQTFMHGLPKNGVCMFW